MVSGVDFGFVGPLQPSYGCLGGSPAEVNFPARVQVVSQRGALPVVATRPDGISMCVSGDVHISRRRPFFVAFIFGLLRLLISVKAGKQTVISRRVKVFCFCYLVNFFY